MNYSLYAMVQNQNALFFMIDCWSGIVVEWPEEVFSGDLTMKLRRYHYFSMLQTATRTYSSRREL